jgi:hypothetical protein
MREAIEIRFEEATQMYKKREWSSCEATVARGWTEKVLAEDWTITKVGAAEDQIFVTCGIPPADRPQTEWKIEKAWPPHSTTGDRVREAARRVLPNACGTPKLSGPPDRP